MSTDLEAAAYFVSPYSGEALTLSSPDVDLGQWLEDVRRFESELRETKRLVNRELCRRFDQRASWTHHYEGGLKLTAASPKPVEQFDGPALREALLSLVDEGVLSIDAVDAAVETVVTYEPRKRGINALRSLGGRVKAVVDAHAVEVEKERYVSVSRTT